MKKLKLFSPKYIALIFLLALGALVYFQTRPKEVHYHAGFLVYKNNQLLDFSGEEFMHREPCGPEEKKDKNDDDHKLDLHDNVGDVVHVHRSAAKWRDLFEETLKLSLDTNVTYYLNNQEAPNLPDQLIKENDQILVLIGENENIDQKLKQMPTLERIQEVGSKSETCG